jgi:small subunit ribosomal protein S11
VAKQETQKTGMVKKPTVSKARKKTQRTVSSGIAHVKATFNNTIVSITDLTGNVVAWASAGKSGYTGSRKSSAFAATIAAQDAAKIAMGIGMKEVEVNLSGPGAGRESAVRGLQSAGLAVNIIRDRTPVPHNGCRPRKRRRV